MWKSSIKSVTPEANSAIPEMIFGNTAFSMSWLPAAMKPAMSRAITQPARSRAVAMCVQRRTGSLSAVSRDTHAIFAGREVEASHWVTAVVLPYPAGAAIKVTGRCEAFSSSSTSRLLVTHSGRAGGGRSLASSMKSTGRRIGLAASRRTSCTTADHPEFD